MKRLAIYAYAFRDDVSSCCILAYRYLKLAKKKLLPPIFDGFISGGMLKQLFGDANMRAEAKVPRVGDHHDKRTIQKYESTLLPGGQIAATVGPLKRPAPHRPLTSHGHEHGHGQGYGYGFGQRHKHEQSHVFDSMCEGEIGGRAGLKSGRPSTSAEVAHTMRPLFNAMSTYHSHLVDKPSNAVPLGVSAPRHNHTGKPTTNNLINTLSARGDLSSARRLSDPKQVSSAPAMGAFASTTSINTTPATTTTTTTTSNSNNDSSKVAANSGPHKVGITTGKSVRGRSPLDVGGAGAGRAMSSTSPWLSSFLTKKEEDASAKGLEGGTVSPRKIGGGGSDGTDDYDDLFDYYYLDKKEARALEQERLLEADESAVPRTQKVKEQVLETKEQVNNRKMRRLYGSLRQQSKAIRTYLLSQITADLGKTPVPLSLPLGGGEGSKKKREGSGSGLGSGDEEKRADGESDGVDDDNEEDLDDEAFIANMEHELNKQRLLAEAEEEIKVRSIKDSVNRLFEAIKNGANAAISDKDKDNSAQLLSEIRTFFALKLETQEHDHRRLQALEFTGEEIGQEAEQSMVGLYESVTGGKADLEKRLRPPVKDLAKIVQMVHLLEQQAGEESSMYLNKYKDEKSAKSEKVSASQMPAIHPFMPACLLACMIHPSILFFLHPSILLSVPSSIIPSFTR